MKRALATVAVLVMVMLGGFYAAGVSGSPDARPVPAIELTQPERSSAILRRATAVTATRTATASYRGTPRAGSPSSPGTPSSNERSSKTGPKSGGGGAPRVPIAPVPAGAGEADDDPDDDPDENRVVGSDDE